MYHAGQGVKQDTEQAIYWLTKAGEQGHPQAQYRLGQMYYAGQGVKQDNKKSGVLVDKSEQHDTTHTKKILSMIYDRGNIKEKNND